MGLKLTPNAPHRISQKLTIAVAGSGLIVFAVTGFLGYCYNGKPTCPASLDLIHGLSAFVDSIFLKPWPLFLWLCMVVFILEHAMLSSLKGIAPEVQRVWRWWTYVITAVCIILVGLFDLYGLEIQSALENLLRILGHHDFLFRVVSDAWFFTVVNFGIILLLSNGAVRRWIRFHREEKRVSALMSKDRQDVVITSNLPESLEMRELVIGDVLVRSTIVLLLSFVIRPDVIGLLIPSPPSGSGLPSFNACSVALPGSPPDRCSPQLSFLDLVIALLGLVGSVAFAAIVAQATVRERMQEQAAGQQQGAATAETSPRSPRLAEIGYAVADELLDILTRPFTSVGPTDEGKRNPYDPLTVVRVIVWPLLIMIGTFGVATMARSTQHALHHTPWQATTLPRIERFSLDVSMFELSGILAGALALTCIILAAGVISRTREALARGLAFIRDNGFTTLVLFCVYAFALWLVEVLVLQFVPLDSSGQPPLRLTAFGFGLATLGSLFLLLWFAVTVIAGRYRTRKHSAT